MKILPINIGQFAIYNYPADRYGYKHTTIKQRLATGKHLTIVTNVFHIPSVLDILKLLPFTQSKQWLDDDKLKTRLAECMTAMETSVQEPMLSTDWRLGQYSRWGEAYKGGYLTEKSGTACGLTRFTDPNLGYNVWRKNNSTWVCGTEDFENVYDPQKGWLKAV